MPDLREQRCFHHMEREAVARCPQCRRYFCRECITEHEDRVICAACLAELGSNGERGRRRLAGLRGFAASLLSFAFLWLCFFWLGRALLLLPASFHEGTVWSQLWQVLR